MAGKRVDIRHVRTHPNVSFEAVLAHYGLETFKAGSDPDQLKVHCPFHDDNDPSCNINTKKRVFNCFPCSSSGNVLDFVMKVEDLDARNGAVKLAEICGVETAPQGANGTKRKKALTPKERITARLGNQAQDNPSVDAEGTDATAVVEAEAETKAEPDANATRDNTPAKFEPYTRELPLDREHPYLMERGLSDEAIAEFELGYCKAGFQKGRVAIRIHDPFGNPLGYAGRWAEAEPPEGTARYLLPRHFPKEQVLFNTHRLPTPCAEVVLVESCWSVFRLWELGIASVSPMGRSLSASHIDVLRDLDVERVTVLFDGDNAGRQGAAHAVEELVKLFYVRSPAIPDGFKPHKASEAALRNLLIPLDQ